MALPRFAAVAAICFLTATAAAQDAPPTPSTPAPAEAVADPSYIIGPGDSIQIYVWRNPELSVTVPVRPDGKISTPLVEDMVAIGKTPSALARDIEKVLSEYVRTPKVNVIVNTAVSVFRQVRVIGQVKTPQALPFRQGMRVLDAILAAGGVTDFASLNRTKIVRQVNNRPTEIHVKLSNLLNKGDMKQNYELLPGDVLIIPQSMF
jgi:polysaccharide biosynthesis/export protein